MTKIIWKANQVISIETRRKDEKRKSNIYVLAQMVGKAELLILICSILIMIGKR